MQHRPYDSRPISVYACCPSAGTIELPNRKVVADRRNGRKDPIQTRRMDPPHVLNGSLDRTVAGSIAVAGKGSGKEATTSWQRGLGQWQVTRVDPDLRGRAGAFGQASGSLIAQSGCFETNESLWIESHVSSGHLVMRSHASGKSPDSSRIEVGCELAGTLEMDPADSSNLSFASDISSVTQTAKEQAETLMQGSTLARVAGAGGECVRWIIGNLLLGNALGDKEHDQSPTRSASSFLVALPEATVTCSCSMDIGSWLELGDRFGMVEGHGIPFAESEERHVVQSTVFQIFCANGGTQSRACPGCNQTTVLASHNPRCITRIAQSVYLSHTNPWQHDLGFNHSTVTSHWDTSTREGWGSLSDSAANTEPVMAEMLTHNTADTTALENDFADLTRVGQPSRGNGMMVELAMGQLGMQFSDAVLITATPVLPDPSAYATVPSESFSRAFNVSMQGDDCANEISGNSFPVRELVDKQPVARSVHGSHRMKQGQDLCVWQRVLLDPEMGECPASVAGSHGSDESPDAQVSLSVSIDAMAEHHFSSSDARCAYVMRSSEDNATMQASTRFCFRQRFGPKQSQSVVEDAGASFSQDLVTTIAIDWFQVFNANVPVLPLAALRSPMTDGVDVPSACQIVTQTPCDRVYRSMAVFPDNPGFTCTFTMVPQLCNRASWCRSGHPSLHAATSRSQVSEYYFPPLWAFQLPQMILADASHEIGTGIIPTWAGAEHPAIVGSASHRGNRNAVLQTSRGQVQTEGQATQLGGPKTCATNLVFHQLRCLRSLRRDTPLSSYLQAMRSPMEVLATSEEISLGLAAASGHVLVQPSEVHLKLPLDNTDVPFGAAPAAAQATGECTPGPVNPLPSEMRGSRIRTCRMQQSFEMSEACQHPTRGGIPDPRAA